MAATEMNCTNDGILLASNYQHI